MAEVFRVQYRIGGRREGNITRIQTITIVVTSLSTRHTFYSQVSRLCFVKVWSCSYILPSTLVRFYYTIKRDSVRHIIEKLLTVITELFMYNAGSIYPIYLRIHTYSTNTQYNRSPDQERLPLQEYLLRRHFNQCHELDERRFYRGFGVLLFT